MHAYIYRVWRLFRDQKKKTSDRIPTCLPRQSWTPWQLHDKNLIRKMQLNTPLALRLQEGCRLTNLIRVTIPVALQSLKRLESRGKKFASQIKRDRIVAMTTDHVENVGITKEDGQNIIKHRGTIRIFQIGRKISRLISNRNISDNPVPQKSLENSSRGREINGKIFDDVTQRTKVTPNQSSPCHTWRTEGAQPSGRRRALNRINNAGPSWINKTSSYWCNWMRRLSAGGIRRLP